MKNKLLWIVFVVTLLALVTGCAAAQTLAPTATPEATPQATAAVVAAATAEPTPEPTATPQPTPEFSSPTTGKEVSADTVSRPVIVSIENSEGARPQVGLMEADIVYEFMVESMITRFQALYNDTYPIYAGPFRSARYYFIDLAQEWDCMYLHLGYGPIEGKYYYSPSKIAGKVSVYPRDGEKQFYGYSSGYNSAKGAYTDYEAKNGYRFRTTDRQSPHNLFILVDKTVQKYYGEHVATAQKRFGFQTGKTYEDGTPFTTVSLPYLNDDDPNWVQFTYNSEDNRLYRKQEGTDFMVRTPSADGETLTDGQFSVQNLIVQYVKYGKMPNDEKGRRTVELTGTGKCDYFINGVMVSGTWSRPTLDDFTTYSLEDGTLVELEPGTTFIAMHPDDHAITVA